MATADQVASEEPRPNPFSAQPESKVSRPNLVRSRSEGAWFTGLASEERELVGSPDSIGHGKIA